MYHLNVSNPGIPIAYTDGFCLRNGRSEARAGVGVCWLNVSLPFISKRLFGTQTSQRAELVAARLAIEMAKKNGFNRIIIRTVSSYLIKSQTEYIHKWQGNNWNNGRVKNIHDFLKLWYASQEIDEVIYEKVYAHSCDAYNNEADHLAKKGAYKHIKYNY